MKRLKLKWSLRITLCLLGWIYSTLACDQSFTYIRALAFTHTSHLIIFQDVSAGNFPQAVDVCLQTIYCVESVLFLCLAWCAVWFLQIFGHLASCDGRLYPVCLRNSFTALTFQLSSSLNAERKCSAKRSEASITPSSFNMVETCFSGIVNDDS